MHHPSKHAPFATFGAIVGSLKMPEVLVQSIFERDKLTQIVETLARRAMMKPRAAVKMHYCAELRLSVSPPKGSTTQSGT